MSPNNPQLANAGSNRIAGALFLVRYCNWHSHREFAPWFLEVRELMSRAVAVAATVVDAEERTDPSSRQLRDHAMDWLEGYDPDSGPFGTKLFQHVNLIYEASSLMEDPGDRQLLSDCIRRASHLAGGAVYRGQRHYQGQWEAVDFPAIEEQAQSFASSNLGEALVLSREFARLYADVMEHSFPT
ncbi:hypothetical protein GCM10010112_12690 [Actinoplanes lobatus]|uniref:Uncharacterized protein n=1 Tax=Actinoplanes lobatus TaxID=113568 RepID=A0A7W7MJX0_9ACTN|nr:hypothetical protein [Actinoplanes lobatus]MBB4753107.1 hypothetical protein [Actinoplanes lobatus]GGN58690.1 hypothetical protein GCM10010112_12690 [Actinoplanes lobatus]GIE43033.1 hypothetical protein Alo02nite_59310 [Actinoplanes lobatus]